jgi:hypothetical protein
VADVFVGRGADFDRCAVGLDPAVPWWSRAMRSAIRKVDAMSWLMTMLVMSNACCASWIMSSTCRWSRVRFTEPGREPAAHRE